jgi:allantoinase
MKGKGLPVTTIVRGNVVADDGKIVAEKGVGTLITKLS